METLRLRKIQQPSHLERLLEAYISRGKFLPSGAYQIRDPGAVPGALRRIAAKAAEEGVNAGPKLHIPGGRKLHT
jgi:hypothetical protein